jgi:hypothetical protein
LYLSLACHPLVNSQQTGQAGIAADAALPQNTAASRNKNRRPGKSTTDNRQPSTEARPGDTSPIPFPNSLTRAQRPPHSITVRAVAWFFSLIVIRDLLWKKAKDKT